MLNEQKGVVEFASGHEQDFMYEQVIPFHFIYQMNCTETG